DPAKAINDFGYIGPVFLAEVIPEAQEVLNTFGLVIGGEHFLMVNPRTNEYNRFSLAAEAQILYVESFYYAGTDLNAVVVARYYFGMLKAKLNFNVEVRASDRLEVEKTYDDDDFEEDYDFDE
ncbi:MAG: hypothetical protein QGG40_18715, partial [Myxococcota bacterium]|nr:hypothetical protein [Myxococcota bacterium]